MAASGSTGLGLTGLLIPLSLSLLRLCPLSLTLLRLCSLALLRLSLLSSRWLILVTLLRSLSLGLGLLILHCRRLALAARRLLRLLTLFALVLRFLLSRGFAPAATALTSRLLMPALSVLLTLALASLLAWRGLTGRLLVLAAAFASLGLTLFALLLRPLLRLAAAPL